MTNYYIQTHAKSLHNKILALVNSAPRFKKTPHRDNTYFANDAWNVLEITSSCCSFVNLIKFTA